MKKVLVGLTLTVALGTGFAYAAPINQQGKVDSLTNPQFGQPAMQGSGNVSAANPVQQENSDLQQLGIPQQVTQIQQNMQALRSLVEIQGHELQQLQLQVQALQSGAGKPVASTSAASASAPSVTNNSDSSASSGNLQGQALYLQAYQLIQSKKYTPASNLLQQYVSKYPKGKSIAAAHYWLGELYAVAGNGDKALTEFNLVVANYPKSEKVSDAMLKLGVINYSKGNYKKAKSWYSQLMAKFPNSSAAQIASTELQQLEKSGY